MAGADQGRIVRGKGVGGLRPPSGRGPASRRAPVERLAWSPEGGFASGQMGSPVAQEEQKAERWLVGRVAARVWPGEDR